MFERPGVVDQRVDATPGIDHNLDRGTYRLFISHVPDECDRVLHPQCLYGSLGRLGILIKYSHPRTPRDQCARCCRADSSAGPGYEHAKTGHCPLDSDCVLLHDS